MALPIFKFYEKYGKNVDPKSVVLMPGVETRRLEVGIFHGFLFVLSCTFPAIHVDCLDQSFRINFLITEN